MKCDATELVRLCARAAHEVNRAYCEAIGDSSQPPWDEAPMWQIDSAIVGVEGVLFGDNGPEASHESWLKHKTLEGWKYGAVKNPATKEHPCFLPYDQLPEWQKAKDRRLNAAAHKHEKEAGR